MKYSKNFNRDYNFYLSNLDAFNFCGTLNPKFEAISDGINSAKECFYKIQSNGQNVPCSEPELLNKLLLTMSSVNFQIKQWAEGLQDGTLYIFELSKRYFLSKSIDKEEIEILKDSNVLEWVDGNAVYHEDIESQYNLPEWVIKAVINQAKK